MRRLRAQSLPAYALLASVVIILGFNWPLLSIGVEALGPLWLTAFRLVGAALIVGSVAGVKGRLGRFPRSDLPVVLSIAAFRLLLVIGLVLTALVVVPPGRSAVLVWTASLWTVPMAALVLGESMNVKRWIGLAAGLVGIVVLVEPWNTDLSSTVLGGYGLLMLAAVANAGTAVHVRYHTWSATPLDLLPWQLLMAAGPAVLAAFVIEGPPAFEWTPVVAGIVVYQGALATGLALWAQITVLQHLPSITTNLTLMLVPVLGVLSSSLVLGEALTPTVIAGGALIAIGVSTAVGISEILPDSTGTDIDQAI